MKMPVMIVGTLLLMVVFAIASYMFSQKQLISMQKKIDSSWMQIEKLQTFAQDEPNNKIDVAGTQYNRLVENYNASIRRFPGSYIAEKNNMHPRIHFNIKAAKKEL